METKKGGRSIGGGRSGLLAVRRGLKSSKLTGIPSKPKDDIGGVWSYRGKKPYTLRLHFSKTSELF